MRQRLAPVRSLVLGLLAVWLGVWPASDAVTGVSRTVVVRTTAAETTPSTDCARSCDEADAVRCPRSQTGQTGQAARCCQCFCLGGITLLGAAQVSLDPDVAQVGMLCPCSEVGRTRHLQPPVPPPWALS